MLPKQKAPWKGRCPSGSAMAVLAPHMEKKAFNFAALEARFVSFRQRAHFVVSIIGFIFFSVFFDIVMR